ncbi:MAG TPA: thioredoxin family protein [Pirellulales bacterium]|nr:thioredoxin family protein [Pirellulales bacterium]
MLGLVRTVVVASLVAWPLGLSVATLAAQGLGGLPGLSGLGNSGPAETPVSVTAEFTPPTSDVPAVLAIHAKIQDHWHIYSTTQPAGGPVRTKITLAAGQPTKLIGEFTADPDPKKHPEPAFGNIIVETHEGEVTWTAPVELPSGADLSSLLIAGKVTVQACTDQNCLPPQSIPFEARLAKNVPATKAPTPATPAKQSSLEAKLPVDDSAAAETMGKYSHEASHAVIEGSLEPKVVEPGGEAIVHLRAIPIEGYHIYALAARDPDQLGMKPTLIQFVSNAGFTVEAPIPNAEPTVKPASTPEGVASRLYKQPIEWSVRIAIPAETKPGAYPIEGLIGYMTCVQDGDRNSCDVPRAARFKGTIAVGSKPTAGNLPLMFSDARYAEAAMLAAAAPGPEMHATSGVTPSVPLVTSDPAPQDMSALPLMIVFSLLGGLILNLMPCVLPVIGLKIFSFVEQAGESRRVAFLLNLWYTAGILAVFLVLATLATGLGLGWGQQFSSTPFNVAMCSVVFVMALSFLGVWEIPIPGFVGSSKANDLASREGALGAFTKGAVTTILATPCSGPFLGSVFGFTISQPPLVTYLIFTCVGLGMALPYLVIGALPELVRFLPKPGVWMETFKQAMGFVLLGAVVFLFSSMPDREYIVPTFALLIGLWAGCWWIGRTPLYEGGAKLAKAYAIGALIAAPVGIVSFTGGPWHAATWTRDNVWLALWNKPPETQELPWRPFTRAALAELTAQGKTVMVDFTADWCQSCQYNLTFAINTREVGEMVERGRVVPLVADWTEESDEIKEMLLSLGSRSIPVLAIFPAAAPEQPIVLRDVITKTQVVEALEKAGPSQQPRNASMRDVSRK